MQHPVMRSFILAGLCMSFSGCTDGSEQGNSRDAGIALPDMRIYDVLVINETIGELFIDLKWSEDCESKQWPHHLAYTFYDREGPRYTKHVQLQVGELEEIPVETDGHPPYVMTSTLPPCLSIVTTLQNVSDGFAYSRYTLRTRLPIEIPVEEGTRTATATWAASPPVFDLLQFFSSDPQGTRMGRISVAAPNGEVLREDRYTLGARSTDYDGYYYVPGTYKITVELAVPAQPGTVWTMTADYWVLGREVCAYGVRWQIC